MSQDFDKIPTLPEKVAIYIPTEFKNTIISTQTKFNHNFKGSTVISAVGSWNGAKGLEIEDITIIYSYVPAITPEIKTFVIALAKDIKVQCSQEAVSVELNNVMYLI